MRDPFGVTLQPKPGISVSQRNWSRTSDFNASTERFVSFPRTRTTPTPLRTRRGFSHRGLALARRQQGGGSKSADNLANGGAARRNLAWAQLSEFAEISFASGEKGWCPGAESNHRHCDFQSHALPTELPGRQGPPRGRAKQSARFIEAGFPPVQTSRSAVGKRSKLTFRAGRSGFPSRLFILPVARLFARVLPALPLGVVLGFGSRNRVVARQPAIEVNVLAAPGTERPKPFGRRLAADRAGS
jgi:hypothetical protein